MFYLRFFWKPGSYDTRVETDIYTVIVRFLYRGTSSTKTAAGRSLSRIVQRPPADRETSRIKSTRRRISRTSVQRRVQRGGWRGYYGVNSLPSCRVSALQATSANSRPVEYFRYLAVCRIRYWTNTNPPPFSSLRSNDFWIHRRTAEVCSITHRTSLSS